MAPNSDPKCDGPSTVPKPKDVIEVVFACNRDAMLCYAKGMFLHLLAPGSIPELGSSSRSTGGSPIRATASESLRLFPPLRVPASWFSVGPRLTAFRADDAAFCSASSLPEPV